MPSKQPRPCYTPGCPGLTRAKYCDQCLKNPQRLPKEIDRRVSSAKRGYGHRWRKWREMILSRSPFCADPFGLHGGAWVLATDVHHIIPKRDGGSDKEDNLQSLCHSCHSRVTAKGG